MIKNTEKLDILSCKSQYTTNAQLAKVSWNRSCIFIGVVCAVSGLAFTAKVSEVPCTNGDSACTDIDNSICKSTKCECSTGYSEDLTDGSTCVQVVSDVSCSESDTCANDITNSICGGEKCKCKDGFKELANTCEKVLESGCTAGNGETVCTVTNSECQNDRCKCKEGYTEVDDVCKKVLESDCTAGNGETVCTVANSECQNEKCKCKEGYTEVDDVCKKEAGETCSNDDECSSNKCEEIDGKKTCAEKNSARLKVFAAGMFALPLFVIIFQKHFYALI